MLDLNYDISKLRGADYNPRKISDEDLARLRKSVTELGMVKPIIVRGDLIVAGHQRTKALRACGIDRAAVFLLGKETTTYDEVRFNQLHNGTDLDVGDDVVSITGGFDAPGYHIVEDHRRLDGNLRSVGAAIRSEIAHLIMRYGPWGGVVATMSGKVIHAGQYLLAAKMTRTPLTVYAVPDEDESKYRSFLDRSYGVFCYDNIERETYVQSLAQMMRLRDGASGKGNRSTLYENHVLPWLGDNRNARLIDFGSGQGDYYRLCRARGFQAWEIELFRRVGANKAINTLAVNRMIDEAIVAMGSRRFDAVVCDSVLNSVDSVDAENAVMTTVNALAENGAAVFFSGRPLEKQQAVTSRTRQSHRKVAHKRELYFEDEDGLTALYRDGRWFFQKFHSKADVSALCERFGLELIRHVHGHNSWQVYARKVRDLPWKQVAAAMDFEFDLPIGKERTIGRNEDVKSALLGFYQ